MNSFRTAASLLVCVGMIACTSQEKPVQRTNPTSSELIEWYVATKEPLTFCPRGHSLPPVRFGVAHGEYVYLADRKTRFCIPIGGRDALACREQALVAREASFSTSERFTRSVSSKIAWVGNTLGELAVVTLVGLGEAAASSGGCSGAYGGMNRRKK